MTTTHHPTDALPLPELPTTSYLGDGNGYGYDASDMYAYGYIVRREGYELAMSKIDDLLSNMDRGVLRMPRDLALDGEMAQVQFYGRVQSLLDRIEALAAPAQEHPHDTTDGSRRWVLVQSLKASKGWATEFAEAFIDEFLSAEAQQQAGAVVDGLRSAEVMALLDSGEWQLERHLPAPYVTDEANHEFRWIVRRAVEPFCGRDGLRVWQGPTPMAAFEKARAALKAGGVA